MKKYIAILALSFSIPSWACECVSVNKDELMQSLDEAEGVYFVVLSEILGSNGSSKLDLTLTVLETLEGKKRSRLEGVGYSTLPSYNDGMITIEETSCDIKYVYGSTYLVMKHAFAPISVTECSRSLIDRKQYNAIR